MPISITPATVRSFVCWRSVHLVRFQHGNHRIYSSFFQKKFYFTLFSNSNKCDYVFQGDSIWFLICKQIVGIAISHMHADVNTMKSFMS